MTSLPKQIFLFTCVKNENSLVPRDEMLGSPIGPLQFTITWYKNRLAGTQTAHWDIQNKAS